MRFHTSFRSYPILCFRFVDFFHNISSQMFMIDSYSCECEHDHHRNHAEYPFLYPPFHPFIHIIIHTSIPSQVCTQPNSQLPIQIKFQKSYPFPLFQTLNPNINIKTHPSSHHLIIRQTPRTLRTPRHGTFPSSFLH